MANPEDRQWTIAVDLAVNLPAKSRYGHLGAEDKMARLRQLQAQTAKSPAVTIVAQEIVPESRDGKTTYSLKRFAIHDGKIDDLTPTAVASKGTAQDLTDLLQVAGKQYPSARIGLVTNSHGNGDDGLIGDNGSVPLPRLQAAIKDGLKGSGHDKLDLGDFDACMMAQVGVLSHMAPAMKQLIASATLENANGGVDGQKLNTWLGDLMKNPSWDGSQLAKDIIKRADQGANDEKGFQGTPTLAHFNLEQPFTRFEKGYEQFASELAQAAARNPESREAIRQAMGEAPGYQSPPLAFATDPLTTQSYAQQLDFSKHDLSAFASSISKLVADHKISDPNGALAAATTELQSSQTAMTEQYHASKKTSDEKGLTAYLPEMSLLNTETAAERTTTVGQVLDLANPNKPIGLRQLNIDALGDAFGQVQRQMQNDPDAQAPLQAAGDAMRSIRQMGASGSMNDQAFEQAEAALRLSAKQLENTGTFKRELGEKKGQIDKIFGHERDVESETPRTKSWGKFIDAANK